jgi:PAS domain S-box-containing protein
MTSWSNVLTSSEVLGELPQASVLVVDDNANKRLALASVIEPLGLKVVEAASGEDALRCVMADDFAVILVDVHMPVMDGLETATLIRRRLKSAMTPIDRYAQGAVDFMFAPVVPYELRAKVTVFANLFVNRVALAERTREVQAYAEQFKLLADAAPIGIFRTDSDNRYEYTNPRWSEITGIPADMAHGKAWDSIIGADQRSGLLADVTDSAQPQAELSHRFQLDSPEGDPRVVVLTSKRTLAGKGMAEGWVGTLADVTIEARAETAMSDARDRADAATKLKSEFLANMSHEIRTPMNGVIGMTELLMETDLDPHQREYADTVRKSGDSLLVIINDILDFSKIENGKFEIEDIEFAVRHELDDVTDLLGGLADAKDLALSTAVEVSVPGVVRGDPSRVRQVLTNFIQNAVKFTQAGEIDVRVSAVAGTGSEVMLRYEVSDTGMGIEPDKLALIFDPFVQADSSTSRRFGGTGLGLAICGRLVTLMGGECGVTSAVGEGSTFWFTVRTTSVGVPEREQDAPLATPPMVGAFASSRLLLAEDDETSRNVVLAMLSDTGCQIDVVDTGAGAIRAAGACDYDAILMDCQMPELSGFEATGWIRAHEVNSGRRTQIIAVTAGARREDRERCLAADMDDYLAKPLRKDSLLVAVGRAIQCGDRLPAVGSGDLLGSCDRVEETSHRHAPGAVDQSRVSAMAGATTGGVWSDDGVPSGTLMGVTSDPPPVRPIGVEEPDTHRHDVPPRVLVVDDDEVSQNVTVLMLEHLGVRADVAGNGLEALEALDGAVYDVVLMDVQMPEMDGLEASRRIRSEGKVDRQPVIIAVTASGTPEEQVKFAQSGMDHFLAKPIRLELLAVALNTAR